MVTLDKYRLDEVAYGHAGFVDSSVYSQVPFPWLEHHLLLPVTARYGKARPVEILYEQDGNWVDLTAAAKSGSDSDCVRIAYENGLTITANGSSNTLSVDGWSLPQFGWLAQGAGVSAGTVLRDAVVTDFADAGDTLFINARSATDWDLTTAIRIHPTVAQFQQTAARKFQLTYAWQVGQTLSKDYNCFVHFCQNGSIKFQQDHTLSPGTSQWEAGQTNSDGPFTVTISTNIADGDYDWLIGLSDHDSGARLQLQGISDSQSRIRLGTLGIQSNGTLVTFVPEPNTNYPDFWTPYLVNLNGTGKIIDFGDVRTDGSASLHRKGNQWVLKTWPRDRNFTLEFSIARFGAPDKIDCSGVSTNELMPVIEGDRWRLPLNGASEYRWNAVVATPTAFNAWSNRMNITFSGYNRSETLTNFPALVVLGESIPGFSYNQFASANGYDLRFSADDGVTELNYEIEKWATSTNSCVWVQVPQLSAGSYIWAYWGNAGAASAPAAYTTNGATWSSNSFNAVWHMGQTNTLDSTVIATNNGIAVTTAGSVSSATGLVGGGLQVASGGHVTIPGNSPYTDFTNSTATYSAWINFNSLPTGEQVIMRKEQNREMGFSDSTHVRSMLKTGGTSGWTTGNDDAINPVVGQWYYVAFIYDGSVIRNFWNGAPLNAGHAVTGPIVGSPYTTSLGAYDGNADAGPVSLGINAIIDEVRIEKVVRSTNWIWATYLTVASNTSFCAYGSVLADLAGGTTNQIPATAWISRYYPGMPVANYESLATSVASNGMTVWQNYLAGSDPTNPASALRVGIVLSNGNVLVTYPTLSIASGLGYTATSRIYGLESATSLLSGTWQPIPGSTNILGNDATAIYTNGSLAGNIYYRVKARLQ